ncbi:MAG: 4-carboxy-4-hydroxy-2-oxoadipate aldolase/oxaloacetate decarboxylase [Pseudomonadota bacterium]
MKKSLPVNTPGIVVRTVRRSSPDNLQRLADFGAATVHEAQLQKGDMHPSLRPVNPGYTIAGNAITVLLQPGDNWMLHVAIELCEPGDVIVAAPVTPSSSGYFGDLLATSAASHGVRGLVIEGGVRDISTLHEMDFPVWSSAVSIKGTVKESLGSVNVPIRCGGQIVYPGDAVVCDDDGVCVVAYKLVDETIDSAEKRMLNEKSKRSQFAAGELGLDIYAMRERLAEAGLRYIDNVEDWDDADH